MVARGWTKENTIKFIELIEHYPQLWNNTNKDYRNRNKKRIAIRNIANVLEVSENEVIRKWHNLRCQLNAEVKKLYKKKNNNGGDMNLKSNWDFYEPMKFTVAMYETSCQRNENTEYSSSNSTDIDMEQYYEECNETEIVLPDHWDNRKKISENLYKVEHEEPIPSNTFKAVKQVDDHTIFGDYVASELRQLRSNKNRRKLKHIIQKAIVAIGEKDDDEHDVLDI